MDGWIFLKKKKKVFGEQSLYGTDFTKAKIRLYDASSSLKKWQS